MKRKALFTNERNIMKKEQQTSNHDYTGLKKLRIIHWEKVCEKAFNEAYVDFPWAIQSRKHFTK